ncbi:MAG TPA: hypothetical protein VLH35_08125 [Candidatus Acidoferrales bacterium]|nr:hypothetical protein [Candidatus Acidoferrales bacterium]
MSPKISALNSDYTTTSVDLAILMGISSGYSGHASLSSGTKIEFQVQSLCGQIESEYSGLMAGSFYDFTGESSDWSNSQIMTVGITSPEITQTVEPNQSPTQTPTFTATQPPTAIPTYTDNSTLSGIQQSAVIGFDWQTVVIAVLAVVVVVLALVMVLQRRGNRKAEGQ